MNNKEIIKQIKKEIETTEDFWELANLQDQITNFIIELNDLTRKIDNKLEEVNKW